MKNEPKGLEIFITKIVFFLYGKSVYKAFADRLPLEGGEQVLDFGCGMGTVACYVAERIPQGKLTCLDISERWLKACRKTLCKYENVIIQKYDANTLKRDCYDLIFCHFVLHDIPADELEKIVPALAESLKPGGMLVFKEPLDEADNLIVIKRLLEQSGLFLKDSRITDIPVMGNSIESIYVK